jgi:uncharacterized membrane protein YhaH (DUF805 family)
MTWGQYLFSFHGRLNHARYWSFLGVTYAIVLVIIVITVAAIANARVSARSISTSATHLNPVLLIALGLVLFALEVAFVLASLARCPQSAYMTAPKAPGGFWSSSSYPGC